MAAPLRAIDGGFARADVAAAGGDFENLLAPLFQAAADRDFTTQMTLVDLLSYLPGDILTKVDRASMATSLEARVPLLDHKLVEFAVALPSHLKLRDGTGKWLLRRVSSRLVPNRVLEKAKKGFSLPVSRWFHTTLRHRVEKLLEPSEQLREYVETSAVARIVGEHLRGRRDHGGTLWRLVVLGVWLELLDRGELAQPSPGRVLTSGLVA
jgi:asparagine synthase (glutamine-hydrolysing)